MTTLPKGMIFDIAAQAGIFVPRSSTKVEIRCPIHDDAKASAFLSENNVYYCSVCTPERGWSAKRFAHALGVPWVTNSHVTWVAPPRPTSVAPPRLPAREPERIQTHQPIWQRVWEIALERARVENHLAEDQSVYDYLSKRGLGPAWDYGAFGILSHGMSLPEPIAWWPREGYRIVAPLYDARGEIVNIQSRTIRPDSDRKTLFPGGTKAKGTLFANHPGLSLLRGSWKGDQRVVLGEGLTDYLALAMTCSYPVLAAPGTGMAVSSIGEWTRGRTLVLALDEDLAGKTATTPAARRAYEFAARRVVNLHWSVGCSDACDELRVNGATALAELLEAAPTAEDGS